MNKPLQAFIIFCFALAISPVNAQQIIEGVVKDQETQQALPYASLQLLPSKESYLTNTDGTFQFQISDSITQFSISYIGYNSKLIRINDADFYEIQLQRNPEELNKIFISSEDNKANAIILEAIDRKPQNNPKQKFSTYQYSSYNKFIIDNQKEELNISADSSNAGIKKVIEDGRNYLAEKSSLIQFEQKKEEKETIEATRTAGFKEPVYELLTTKVQSNSWYEKDYVIFGSEYASPLSNKAFKNYNFKILDTTSTQRPAYVILFQPKKNKNVAHLEGVLYIDTENYGLQKAIAQLKGKANLEAVQEFSYYPKENIWFPKQNTVTIKPGNQGKGISIFGGNIDLGRLPEKSDNNEKLYLKSVTTYQDVEFNIPLNLKSKQAKVQLSSEAIKTSDSTWQKLRTIPFTSRDQKTFQRVDSVIKAENIDRKIELIQHFNNGYFPLGFFDFDLRRIIKYNRYEGFRLGLGGVTNDNLSEKFRLQGYGVYGFKDREAKYSFGGGVLLNKKKQTWLNAIYTDDIAEVGSFFYLTDARVYSLFEPRLVNINYYYKYRKSQISLQHRFLPELLSEFQISRNSIEQTRGYIYNHNNQLFSSYKLTILTASFRWTPFSDYLQADDRSIEIKEGYPIFSFQAEQALNNILGSDFAFTKFATKINYTYKRLNQTATQFILEGNYAVGDLPLTHTFHAYPNNPNKGSVFQRFSVAGRRTFETMYYSEFFIDKLVNLQVKHFFRPLELGKRSKPQLVLITRHAIGGMKDKIKHLGINFEKLDRWYNESGFEVNNIFAGFGLNFAYRYGYYHLPEITDNISFKFTFYFKL